MNPSITIKKATQSSILLSGNSSAPLNGEIAYATDTNELYVGMNGQWVSIGTSGFSANIPLKRCSTCYYNINNQCMNSKLNPTGKDFEVDSEFTCEHWQDQNVITANVPIIKPVFPDKIDIHVDYSNEYDWTTIWPISNKVLNDSVVIKI